MKPIKKLIGIDPGVNTGWAELEGKDLKLETIDILEALDRIQSEPYKDCVFYIENPAGNVPVFAKSGVANSKANSRIARNIGGVQKEGEILIGWAKKKGVTVYAITPSKSTFTKLSSDQFKAITGYKGQSNNHERDAAMLIWGRV